MPIKQCFRCFNAYLEWLQILLCIYLMPILNGYKFYCVYASRFFIFGRGPCHIVVLRGPGAKKGPKWLIINDLGLIIKL